MNGANLYWQPDNAPVAAESRSNLPLPDRPAHFSRNKKFSLGRPLLCCRPSAAGRPSWVLSTTVRSRWARILSSASQMRGVIVTIVVPVKAIRAIKFPAIDRQGGQRVAARRSQSRRRTVRRHVMPSHSRASAQIDRVGTAAPQFFHTIRFENWKIIVNIRSNLLP